MKICIAVILTITIQSGHKFAYVTTAQLSWHVQTCDLIRWLVSKWKQHEFLWDLGFELITFCKMGPRSWGNVDDMTGWSIKASQLTCGNLRPIIYMDLKLPRNHTHWDTESLIIHAQIGLKSKFLFSKVGHKWGYKYGLIKYWKKN